MDIAQHLYEVGAITYMRTNSTEISKYGLDLIETHMKVVPGMKFGGLAGGNSSSTAHEAIRPTFAIVSDSSDEFPTDTHKALYALIVSRTCNACTPVKLVKHYSFEIDKFGCHDDEHHVFVGTTTNKLVNNGDNAKCECVELAIEHRPPGVQRFNEATLVKTMDALGIGRPSTYVSTLERLYKQKFITSMKTSVVPIKTVWDFEKRVSRTVKGKKTVKKELVPNTLGSSVVDYLQEHFEDIIDTRFTRNMEGRLDEIEKGVIGYKVILQEFWLRFEKYLESMTTTMTPVDDDGVPLTASCSYVYTIDGKPYCVRTSKFGAVIENKEDRKYVGLGWFLSMTGKTIDQVTKNDVVFLLSFPRPLKYKQNGTINYGRYGFFITDVAPKNFTIDKNWFDGKSVYDVIDYVLLED